MLAWWTLGLPGRNSSPRTKRVFVTGRGMTKMRKTSVPSACSEYACGSVTMRSGLPRRRGFLGECRALVCSFALGGAARDPLLDAIDFVAGQWALAGERAVFRIGFPWRHVAVTSNGGNLGRVSLRVRVGEQAERSRALRDVTHPAALREQWRDVPGV